MKTRVYILDGPEECERGRLNAKNEQVALLKKLAASTKGVESSISEIKNTACASENVENSSSSISSTADEPVPEKHRKLLERIQAKKYKQNNVHIEMQRIRSKAMSVELTSGQSSQLEKLESRDALLVKEIEDLEATLSEKIHQASHNNHAVAKRKKTDGTSNYDEDLDSLYDRTSAKRLRGDQMKDRPVAETEQSLIEKCTALFDQMKHKKGITRDKEKKLKAIEEQLQSIGEDNDEHFFVNNKLELAKEEFNSATDIIRSIDKDITEIEEIFKYSDNKIVVDRELMFVGSDTEHAQRLSCITEHKLKEESVNEFHMIMPPPMSRGVLNKNGIDNLMPPPSHTSSPTKKCQGVKNNDGVGEGSREICGAAVKVQREIADELKIKERTKKQKAIKGPMRPQLGSQGTLSIVKELLLEKGNKHDKHARRLVTHDNEPLDSTNQNNVDQKIDEWVAPSNQDGSGKTKLNDKFRGRY